MLVRNFNTSQTIYLSLFFMHQNGNNFNYPYSFFRVFEVLLIICSIPLVIFSIQVTRKVYHFNFSLIYAVFASQWFELFISRLLIAPYQEGIIPLPITISSFYSSSDGRIITIDFADCLPMIIGSFLRLRYVLVVVMAMPVVCFERFLAVLLIRNYERKRRPMISIFPIIFTQIFATFTSFLMTLTYLQEHEMALFVSILELIALLIFFVIQYYTKELDRRCETSTEFYTLSIKYQICETIRSMKLVQILFCEVIVLIVLVASCISLYLQLSCSVAIYIAILIEFGAHIHPVITCSTAVLSIPQWRRRFVQCLPGSSRVSAQIATVYEQQVVDTSHAYFEQLKTFW